MEVIGDYYAELRSQADTNALPITVRTLETIIASPPAAAKARLSTGAPACHAKAPAAQALVYLMSSLSNGVLRPPLAGLTLLRGTTAAAPYKSLGRQ